MKPMYINPDFNPLDAQPVKRARKIGTTKRNPIKPDIESFFVPKVKRGIVQSATKQRKPKKLQDRVIEELLKLAVGKSVTIRNLTDKQWDTVRKGVARAKKHVRRNFTTRSVDYNEKTQTRTIRIWRII